MLEKTPNMLSRFYDILAKKAKIDNPSLAQEIFRIYRNYVTKDITSNLIQ